MSVFKTNSSKLSDNNTLHQYQKPNNSLRVNPLAFHHTLKDLDMDKLEEDLAKEIQKKKSLEDREKVTIILTIA